MEFFFMGSVTLCEIILIIWSDIMSNIIYPSHTPFGPSQPDLTMPYPHTVDKCASPTLD